MEALINQLLAEGGHPIKTIAYQVGCCTKVVRRIMCGARPAWLSRDRNEQYGDDDDSEFHLNGWPPAIAVEVERIQAAWSPEERARRIVGRVGPFTVPIYRVSLHDPTEPLRPKDTLFILTPVEAETGENHESTISETG